MPVAAMPSPPASDQRSDLPPLVLSHQKPAFERLLAIGRASFGAQRHTLPVRLRTNSLIIGPTGSGKTHLAKMVAEELGLGSAFLSLSVSDWVLLSSTRRGAENTWTTIYRFLRRIRKDSGAIIFLDELDKLSGQCDYEQYQRVEVFALLDSKLPPGLVDNEDDPVSESGIAEAQEVLSNRSLIIGAGAFQDLWETRAASPIGFREGAPSTLPPTPQDLSQTLPRELVNRFRRELLILPPLQHADYVEMLETTAVRVPAYLRQNFLKLGRERIPAALEMQQGCRYLEDLMLETILTERECLRASPSIEGQHI
jgi:SpoVK/Ycf46/Vps4 family AAA+-type ATPase